jgi:hypothetical protein
VPLAVGWAAFIAYDPATNFARRFFRTLDALIAEGLISYESVAY